MKYSIKLLRHKEWIVWYYFSIANHYAKAVVDFNTVFHDLFVSCTLGELNQYLSTIYYFDFNSFLSVLSNPLLTDVFY